MSTPCPTGLLRMTNTEESFIRDFLRDTLEWPIPAEIGSLAQLGYPWDLEELGIDQHEARLASGTVWQIAPLVAQQPMLLLVLQFMEDRPLAAISSFKLILRGVYDSFRPGKRGRSSTLPAAGQTSVVVIVANRWEEFGVIRAQRCSETQSLKFEGCRWDKSRYPRLEWRQKLIHLSWPEALEDWQSLWSPAFSPLAEMIEQDVAQYKYLRMKQKAREQREWKPEKRKGPAPMSEYDHRQAYRNYAYDPSMRLDPDFRSFFRAREERAGATWKWDGWTDDCLDFLPAMLLEPG